jgi:RNA polymerase sigma factor (sigma-70 family)
MRLRGEKERDEQPTVYVVDDSQCFREHVTFLAQEIGLPVSAFASGLDFLDVVTSRDAGCVVLDFRLPEVNGLIVIEILTERNIQMPVILTSGFLDVETAVQAMKAGCVDVIEKGGEGGKRLLCAIQRAIVKDRERRQTCAERDVISSRKAKLTPRESEVMELVVAGKRSKEIAAELGISVGTVEIHRARIMRKMGAESVVELVREILKP